jgi:hypothetical protein
MSCWYVRRVVIGVATTEQLVLNHVLLQGGRSGRLGGTRPSGRAAGAAQGA